MAGDWLGAVGSLAGGLVNGAFSMAGAEKNSQAIKETNAKNLAYADYYNNNKIQMLVADAKKAGVSPYAVLGSAGGSMSPNLIADTSQGDALGKVGDAMQNALVNATFDKIDNNTKMDDLEVQLKELEIQEKKAQIAKMNNQNAFGSDIPSNGVASVMGLPPTPASAPKGFRTGEVLDVGKGLQLQKRLDGKYLLTVHPESMQGQMVSEGYANQVAMFIDLESQLSNGGFDLIKKDMAKAGLIPQGYDVKYFWTPFGYVVDYVKKGKK